MDSATFTMSNLVDNLTKAVYGTQTEICIFLFAFFLHAIFFGRLRVRSTPAQRKDEKVLLTGNKPQDGASVAKPPRCSHAKQLASVAEHYCELKDAAKLAADLSIKIQSVPAGDTLDALAGLLEGSGNASTPQLLAAVRGLLHKRGLKPNVDLGELLLRNYFRLRLLGDFDEVYNELVSTHGVVSSIGVLALKSALASADLQACLDRSSCLKPLLSNDSNSVPSAMFASLLQQIVRLAAQQRALSRLLKCLEESDLLHAALDPILVECVKHGDPTDIQAVLYCSQEQGLHFGEPAYCALIKSTKSMQEARSLFSEALETFKTPAKEIFTVAAEWAHDNSDKHFAYEVLQKLPSKPPGEALGKLLQVVCDDQSRGLALQTYIEKFQGADLSADISAMSLVAKDALEDGPAGREMLASMLLASTEQARVSLVKSLASEQQLPMALEVFRLSPDKAVCLYNATIDACIECSSIAEAQQVMSEAMQAGVADIITYNTIVKAYLQAKRPMEARQAIKSMKALGIQPNMVTFNELLDGMVKSGIENAWPVLSEIKASDHRPNRITCAILLKAVQARTKAHDVERAIAVLDEIGEDIDEVLLCSVVDACIRAGRPELLIPQLKRHRAHGRIMMKTASGAHTYGSIIRAYGFVRDLGGVWETWREMCTRHMPANPVTLGCMTEALVTNGEPEAAYELINEMLKDDQWAPLVNAVIYCSVLKGFSHQKRFDRMWQVYREMLGLNLKFSIVTFNTLLDACSRNGEMSRIPSLLKDMDAQGIPPNIITYSAILKGYCQGNRIEEAFSVFEGMVQTTNIRPDEIMFNTLLDGCARKGKGFYEKGLDLLEDMQNANITPTNFTLSVLVKLASRSKKLDKAFDLCQEISAKYRFRLNVHVYANLINACITHKELDRAFDVLESMLTERVRPDTRTYSLLLRGCVAACEGSDAAGLMRAAVGLRGPDVHPRLTNYDARLLQPQAGIPNALITEILDGLAGECHNERLAVALHKELRALPHITLDPKLQFRLATSALNR